VFRLPVDHTITLKEAMSQWIDGKYANDRWQREAWRVAIWPDGKMNIGCQTFSVEETKQLRRWALAKRRKK
jgi:hypothetical protein